MLLKRIFYFSSATTALAIGAPVVAYLIRPVAKEIVNQESRESTTQNLENKDSRRDGLGPFDN